MIQTKEGAPFTSSCPNAAEAKVALPVRSSYPAVIEFLESAPYSSSCPNRIEALDAPVSSSCPRTHETLDAPVSSSCPRTHETLDAPVSSSCPQWQPPRGLPYLHHAFSVAEIELAAQDASCAAVLGHGVRAQLAGLKSVQLATEYAPVFVSRSNPVADMSLSTIRSIVSGHISQWKDLATSFDQPIRLYLHGGNLQKRKFQVLAKSIGADISGLEGSRAQYGASYEELEQLASADPAAIVIGLKVPRGQALHLIRIDGAWPRPGGYTSYPLVMPIYFYSIDPEAGAAFAEQVRQRLLRNMRQYSEYSRQFRD